MEDMQTIAGAPGTGGMGNSGKETKRDTWRSRMLQGGAAFRTGVRGGMRHHGGNSPIPHVSPQEGSMRAPDPRGQEEGSGVP